MKHTFVNILRFQNLYPGIAGLALCILKSTAIITIAAAAAALLRTRSARARNWVWRLALTGLLGLALWQVIPAPVRPHSLIWRAVPSSPAAESTLPGLPRPMEMTGPGHSADQSGMREASLMNSVERWITPLWIGMAALLLAIHILRVIAGSLWMRRHSQPDNGNSVISGAVEIRSSRLLDTPLLAGFFRPAIYLPAAAADWSAEKRRQVLLHEMAHLSRGDIWWQFAGTCSACLWWWSPLAWMALARLKAEAEEAADDLVILQDAAAETYARLLVDIASVTPRRASVGIPMLGRTSMERRVRHILNDNPWRNTLGAWGLSLLGAVCALIILSMSAVIVLGDADLTNTYGEILHYQANPAENELAQGNFLKTKGSMQGWTGDTASVSSPEPGTIELKAAGNPSVIETTLAIQPAWKWLTVIARLHPNYAFLYPKQLGVVSFTPEDAAGKPLGNPAIISENRESGYMNWTSRFHTIAVPSGATQLKVQVSLSPGKGALDCSEILVIPTQPSDELDHRLVDRFFKAIEANDPKTVTEMLAQEPKLVDSRKGRADNGTPLILCAWLERPEIAQILVDHGANLKATDTSSWKSSALNWCGWWGSPKTAAVLLKAGADPNFRSVYDVTPLNAAIAGKKSNKASTATPEAFDETIALFRAAHGQM